jgi:hypothetical protein
MKYSCIVAAAAMAWRNAALGGVSKKHLKQPYAAKMKSMA